MNLEQYTPLALSTAKPTALTFDYLGPGIVSEAHELAAASYGHEAKIVRDGHEADVDKLDAELVKEAGDVLWFAAASMAVAKDLLAAGLSDGQLAIELERAQVISTDGKLLDPLEEVLRRAGLVARYGELAQAGNPLGAWLAYSEAWALWHHLEKYTPTITGYGFDHVLDTIVAKLLDRQERGVITGTGGNR